MTCTFPKAYERAENYHSKKYFFDVEKWLLLLRTAVRIQGSLGMCLVCKNVEVSTIRVSEWDKEDVHDFAMVRP